MIGGMCQTGCAGACRLLRSLKIVMVDHRLLSIRSKENLAVYLNDVEYGVQVEMGGSGPAGGWITDSEIGIEH